MIEYVFAAKILPLVVFRCMLLQLKSMHLVLKKHALDVNCLIEKRLPTY